MILNELNGQQVHPMLRFHVLVRLNLLLVAIGTVLLVAFVPGAPYSQVLGMGGKMGAAVLCLLTFAAGLGAVDMLVNDVMRGGDLSTLRENRHLIYMLIGAAYAAQAVAVIGSGISGEVVVLGFYLINTVQCAMYAVAAITRPSHAL